jgi:hypothetical protein
VPNVEWDVVQSIVSPYATLQLNTVLPLGGRDYGFIYMVRHDGYKIVPAKFRLVQDSISQADGSSLQQPLIDGMVATLRIEYWTDLRDAAGDRKPACGEDVRLMNEELSGVLNSLRVWTADPNNNQRYIWLPTGTGGIHRMLTNVLLVAWPEPTQDPPIVSQTFSLGTPLPYAISENETTTDIADGGSATITNPGNASVYPVFIIDGPTSACTITNTTTGAAIIYDASRPGASPIAGGHFVEIDSFQGTVILDGSVDDTYIAAIDPTSVFFPLAPDAQTITAAGADIHIRWNPAYV